jgi:hypothetical protein
MRCTIKDYTTGATGGAGTAYPSFLVDRCLSFFIWPLYCPSFDFTASECPFGIYKLFFSNDCFLM